jgi:hypothetical protein
MLIGIWYALFIDKVTRSSATLNAKRQKNHLGFFKSMPPIKKSAKLASGRDKEVKRWLPLVNTIRKNRKINVLIDLNPRFFIKVIF